MHTVLEGVLVIPIMVVMERKQSHLFQCPLVVFTMSTLEDRVGLMVVDMAESAVLLVVVQQMSEP